MSSLEDLIIELNAAKFHGTGDHFNYCVLSVDGFLQLWRSLGNKAEFIVSGTEFNKIMFNAGLNMIVVTADRRLADGNGFLKGETSEIPFQHG